MEEQIYKIGDRVEKTCAVCQEERGHIISSVTKRNLISRVSCPKCKTVSTFKNNQVSEKKSAPVKVSAEYDRARTYRAGQTMLHPAYGEGEVTALIEERKIDVLFADRMRRLIHAVV